MFKKATLFFFYFYLFSQFSYSNAQDIFKLNGKTEIALLGTGLSTLLLSKVVRRTETGLSPSQINQLNKDDIWQIDRFVVAQKWAPAARISDIAFGLGFSSTLWLMTEKTMRNDFFVIGFMAFETALLTTGITYLTKNICLRTRPFVYNPYNTLFDKKDKDARHSFFSGHTSLSTSMCFFTAQTLSYYFKNTKVLRYAWLTALAIPISTGAMRILSGKHFLTDVATGYLVGAGIGLIIPYLHSTKNKSFSLNSGIQGISLTFQF